jgi:hypothetical protein
MILLPPTPIPTLLISLLKNTQFVSSPSIFISFYDFFVTSFRKASKIIHSRPFLENLLLADKNTKKIKILKSLVWEAQSTGIISASLGDTVSAHTAYGSTRLVRQFTKEFF